MNKVTKVGLVAFVAVVALVGGYLMHAWILPPTQVGEDPGAVLLGATVPDHNGRPQALSQWQGKVLVVNFWATWCPPCIKEIPELVRVQQRFGPQGVQVVGIAIDDKDKVVAFTQKFGLNYPSLVAEADGLVLARRAGNRLGGLPFTVVIDRKGNAAKIELGAIDEAKLAPILQQLL